MVMATKARMLVLMDARSYKAAREREREIEMN
jgi:hypothetical protein